MPTACGCRPSASRIGWATARRPPTAWPVPRPCRPGADARATASSRSSPRRRRRRRNAPQPPPRPADRSLRRADRPMTGEAHPGGRDRHGRTACAGLVQLRMLHRPIPTPRGLWPAAGRGRHDGLSSRCDRAWPKGWAQRRGRRRPRRRGAADRHQAVRRRATACRAPEEDDSTSPTWSGLRPRRRRAAARPGARRCTTTAPAPLEMDGRRRARCWSLHPRRRCRWWTSPAAGSWSCCRPRSWCRRAE